MSIFEKVLAQAMKAPEAAPGDYYKDGLLYCGKCNTPKETLRKIFDSDEEPRRLPIMCRCDEERVQREDAARRLDARKNLIKENIVMLEELGAAIRPSARFEMNDGANQKNTALVKGYAERFEQLKERNIGMMLYGSAGAGKTFFAECIANDLIERGLFAWFTNIRMLTAAMGKGDERKILLRFVRNVDLLILDDFGAERDTSYMVEQVYEIINTRCEAKMPLIVTTNLDPAIMAAEPDVSYKRGY